MDIKVITRHAPSNYGSLLQAIATVKIMERMGHDCKIIDYQRGDERGMNAITTALACKKEWARNPLKRLAYIGLRYPEEHWAELKFEKMRQKHLKMTERCSCLKDLSALKADIFMTGSDQVWGPTMNGRFDEAYFLDFVKKGKKVAYAASFGRTNFDTATIEAYSRMLSSYDAIAVRENSAVEMLDKMGIKCAGQVLDPTLLLTGAEWSEMASKRKIQGDYVLIYQIHNNPMLDNYAKAFSRHVGLPLYRMSASFHQVSRGGKFVYLPDVTEFLSLLKHCRYFITDSFHGTAFAINFNRQFIEILPNNSTGTRNQSILQLTGLQDRIVRDESDFSIADKTIDYQGVNDVMEKERQKSLDVLRNLVKIR